MTRSRSREGVQTPLGLATSDRQKVSAWIYPSRRAVAGHRHLVALCFEPPGQEIGDAPLVLDDQDLHGGDASRACSKNRIG